MSTTEPPRQLGYTTATDTIKPFAKFLTPDLPPLTPQCLEALSRGPRAPELLDNLSTVATRLQSPPTPLPTLETGYALTPSGGMIVSCLHHLPRCTPAMWEWWFSWHGHDSARYKLWHPLAHVDARWSDGRGFTGEYIGRTSDVAEYIGGKLLTLAIRFVPPKELGFDEEVLREKGEAVICAKGIQKRAGGMVETQVGTFLHHVKLVEGGGCEMRSRFWLAGEFVRPSNVVTRTVARFMARTEEDAIGLLVHNAEEMAHLGEFLPELYEQFKDEKPEA